MPSMRFMVSRLTCLMAQHEPAAGRRQCRWRGGLQSPKANIGYRFTARTSAADPMASPLAFLNGTICTAWSPERQAQVKLKLQAAWCAVPGKKLGCRIEVIR